MYKFEVGKRYNPRRSSWPEIAQFNFRGGQCELVLFYKHPSAQETMDIRRGVAELRLVNPSPAQIILCYKFGLESDWSDSPYTIHRVPAPERILPEPLSGSNGYLLQIVLVDAADGVIWALRAISLSPEYSAALRGAILRQAETPFDSADYDKELAAIFDRFSSSDLARSSQTRFSTAHHVL